MRPTITRKHVFLGAVIDDVVKQHLSKLKQPERDDLLSNVMSELYGKLPRTSARLGTDRFTIVTDEEGANALKKSAKPGFEPAINQLLLARTPKL